MSSPPAYPYSEYLFLMLSLKKKKKSSVNSAVQLFASSGLARGRAFIGSGTLFISYSSNFSIINSVLSLCCLASCLSSWKTGP